MESNDVLARQLNKAWRFLNGRGFVDGFGHLSARTSEPGQFLATPHSLTPDSRPEDFVLVDIEGRPIDSDVRLPSELPIHLEIYRKREDVGSVCHLHFLYSTSFSVTDQHLGISYFLASLFRRGIPIHQDPRLVTDRERGEALAETLGPHRAVLMKAHGVAVAGADVQEMLAAAYLLEENARRTWVSAAVGNVEFLDDELMAEIEAEMLASRGPIRRIWALCESEAGVED